MSPKERPILFSAPMVRAIIEGRKTQTRRVVKGEIEDVAPPEWYAARRLFHRSRCQRPYCENVDDIGGLACGGFELHPNGQMLHQSAYGVPGDRLWVRETWCPGRGLAFCVPGEVLAKAGAALAPGIIYRADDAHLPTGTSWRPSIHMPRWASRITLVVTGVRVERLRDISEEDAKAEGVERTGGGWLDYTERGPWDRASNSFRSLWASIHGEEEWGANPWVWVIEFRRAEAKSEAA